MRESVLLVVGAVVAVVLQIVLAPNLVILGSMPDLVLVYVGIAAMLLRRDSVLVMAFFAGLVMDLVGTSTVGVCAGLLRAGRRVSSATIRLALRLLFLWGAFFWWKCFMQVSIFCRLMCRSSKRLANVRFLARSTIARWPLSCCLLRRTCLRRQRLLTRRQLPRPFVFAKGVAWCTLSWPRLLLSSLQAWLFSFSLGPETSNRVAPCRNR